MERHVYRNLVRDSGMAQSSLQRLFKHYLSEAPELNIRHKQEAHLLIDGTYFPNDLCLVLYYDHDIRFTQLYRFTDEERYTEIREDLENIRRLGIDVVSITCDGHRSLLKSIRKVFPKAIIQRCVVHVVRQCRTWLTKHPQHITSFELLKIVEQLHSIKTLEQSGLWLLAAWRWEKEHSDFIHQKVMKENGKYWFKHKMLRKARYLLLRAIPNLFGYLDNPDIPATTNRLEAFSRHLKEKLGVHHGLTLAHKKNFIKWYLFFQNQRQ